jgi:hypothetical protein
MGPASPIVVTPGRPPGGQQALIRLDRPPQLRDVVAEHRAEPPRFQEIALHVDDDERTLGGLERELVRLSLDRQNGHHDHLCSALLELAVMSNGAPGKKRASLVPALDVWRVDASD